ncbi:unnamed protein product [Rotaria sp. Silwood2]|nr:unnamed protein product [Rotaria sp. Silwood2]
MASDITSPFVKTRNSNCSKRSRASSMLSISGTRMENITDRQSLGSIFYWDTSLRNATSKKSGSRWSIDFPKETPFYWSLRSRLIEEYTESESLLQFAKKTVLVLMKTKEATVFTNGLVISDAIDVDARLLEYGVDERDEIGFNTMIRFDDIDKRLDDDDDDDNGHCDDCRHVVLRR